MKKSLEIRQAIIFFLSMGALLASIWFVVRDFSIPYLIFALSCGVIAYLSQVEDLFVKRPEPWHMRRRSILPASVFAAALVALLAALSSLFLFGR